MNRENVLYGLQWNFGNGWMRCIEIANECMGDKYDRASKSAWSGPTTKQETRQKECDECILERKEGRILGMVTWVVYEGLYHSLVATQWVSIFGNFMIWKKLDPEEWAL